MNVNDIQIKKSLNLEIIFIESFHDKASKIFFQFSENQCSKRLHNNLSDTYLSRYYYHSLDYQCQHTATIP